MKLSVTNLGKQYRQDFWGLKDFSLDVGPGILGLLGPNGAGKSTLMRMLATITRPTDGNIKWNEIDIVTSPDTMRAVLGYLPQDFGVYPNLNAIEFLEYMAAIKGLDGASTRTRIHELLQVVNLMEAAKRPLGGYSGGMRQRVGIAQALLNDPQLLIVDEPTVGLDPEELSVIRNHHERWDGRGYPDRLQGQKIPLLARILAVADAFDAMNSDRAYRRALPSADCMQELRKGCGTQFEPLVVEAALHVLTKR